VQIIPIFKFRGTGNQLAGSIHGRNSGNY
jgi:hypothetical protein